MKTLLERLDIQEVNIGVSTGQNNWLGDPGDARLASINPTTGEVIAEVTLATKESYDQAVEEASEAFDTWRSTPAPARGQVIRDLGNALRDAKSNHDAGH